LQLANIIVIANVFNKETVTKTTICYCLLF